MSTRMFTRGLFLAMTTAVLQVSARTLPTGSLGVEQIRNYIVNIVDTLISDGGSVANVHARAEIANRVYRDVTRARTFGELWDSRTIIRQDTYVYDETIKGICDYSAGKSFDIAYARTWNTRVAQRVKDRILVEMKSLYNASGTLMGGAFKPYVGNALVEKVNQLCNQFDTPYIAPKQPQLCIQKLYTEKDCRVCFETFSSQVVRIYLKPCGHDICVDCARKHFIDYKNNTCPACRRAVDRHELEKSLAQHPKLYPSSSCCICLNDFGSGTRQVFLRPCGHDMCADCARDFFIIRHNNTCPHCRQKVDVDALANILPSAPPL